MRTSSLERGHLQNAIGKEKPRLALDETGLFREGNGSRKR